MTARLGVSVVLALFLAFAGLSAKAADAPAFEIAGAVDHPARLTADDLRKLPAVTATVFFHTGRGGNQATYTGVSLWSLLKTAGVKMTPGVHNDGLHKYIVAKASDGYYAVIALAELDPEYGGQQAFLAYAQDDKPLDSIRLIMPGDKGGGRNVMKIAKIEVRGVEP